MVERSSTKVAFVLKGYPRLSETFIAQEIEALEKLGLDITIVSLRHPTDKRRHAVHGRIKANILYLPEYLWREPMRVIRAWMKVRHLPGYKSLLSLWWRDLMRDPTPNRGRRLGQALVLAAELDPGIGHLHAHFIHTPASVTRYCCHLLGLPWSASAHARDIYTTQDWEKREKLADCLWAVTCTDANLQHLRALAPDADLELVYHGLDFSRFPRPQMPLRANAPAILLSVGRAVEKKGYDDLLHALALLPKDLAWRFVHLGGGKLMKPLRKLAATLGLSEHIDWRGQATQDEVIAALHNADLFVLASRMASDGDRDGLPNVLMEAQSQGLACISTRISAIPELIDDGRSGILIEPRDRPGLARAIEFLLRDSSKRQEIGQEGMNRVRRDFDMQKGIARLAARFGLKT